MSIKRLIVIVGPTGSGKTDLSIRLALHYRAPILSTDSRQVYRSMPIGTAQPTDEQLKTVEHHFIASHDIKDRLNCGEYEVQALACLEKLFAQHDDVVAVGGSGLYVRALCEGMDELPQADEALRRELERRLADEGIGALAAQLLFIAQREGLMIRDVVRHDVQTTSPDTLVADIMPMAAEAAYPIAVVDGENHLKGIVTKASVLSSLI